MNETAKSFEVGFEFESVLAAISKQIYDTPYAFLRENLQNAIDATRIQAKREGIPAGADSLRIDVRAENHRVQIHDRGNGMTSDDLRHLFWRIGASGKRNAEARSAGAVGMFGIGGFANLGVCDTLVVTSQASGYGGHRTELSRSAIEEAVSLPKVAQEPSSTASPRGTIVEGFLSNPISPEDLKQYIQEIVRYCGERIYFNGELLSKQDPTPEQKAATLGSPQTCSQDGVEVTAQFYELPGQLLACDILSLSRQGQHARISGRLSFSGSGLDIRKQGFNLCSTTLSTAIGASGFIDSDVLYPTAGRDSLNAESQSLLVRVVAILERAAIEQVLRSSELIEQHTRIFSYVRRHGLIASMGHVRVGSADGHVYSLDELQAKAAGGARVYFGAAGNAALTNVLQSQGHIVIGLPSDRHKGAAIRDFLSSVGAADLRGQVECIETYEGLSRFEKAFLAELAETVAEIYRVQNVTYTPGRMTEDIPVYVVNPSSAASTKLRMFVDVRHDEISKLSQLGLTPLFRSMVSVFCREYLGPTLRSRSPKFFGSGGVNLEWLARNRSEAWVLMTDDIAVVDRAARRQVVRASDIRVVVASPGPSSFPQEEEEDVGAEPKLVKIIEGGEGLEALEGFYLRIPDSATAAYGDVIVASDDRGAVWMGNKILLLASDGVSTAFQFEVRLDRLLRSTNGASLSQGAVEVGRSVQDLFGGLYFPLPKELEQHLVPVGDDEIRIEVRCDWLDFAGSRSWEPAEVNSNEMPTS